MRVGCKCFFSLAHQFRICDKSSRICACVSRWRRTKSMACRHLASGTVRSRSRQPEHNEIIIGLTLRPTNIVRTATCNNCEIFFVGRFEKQSNSESTTGDEQHFPEIRLVCRSFAGHLHGGWVRTFHCSVSIHHDGEQHIQEHEEENDLIRPNPHPCEWINLRNIAPHDLFEHAKYKFDALI